MADDGVLLVATPNVFWDQHVLESSVSLLNSSTSNPNNLSTCTITCGQQYSACGSTIATFTLTFKFNKGTLSGTPVTNVVVSEQ
jgi:hypothetical protein